MEKGQSILEAALKRGIEYYAFIISWLILNNIYTALKFNKVLEKNNNKGYIQKFRCEVSPRVDSAGGLPPGGPQKKILWGSLKYIDIPSQVSTDDDEAG